MFQCGLILLLSVSLSFSEGSLVYQIGWQECKVDSDCVTIREGYNWTCVNKAYENEARNFCKQIDEDGDEKNSFEGHSIFPATTCLNGRCSCKESVSGLDNQKCEQDDDCIVVKGGNYWTTINKKTPPAYIPYGGDAHKQRYQYPKPIASCLNGVCSIEGYWNKY